MATQSYPRVVFVEDFDERCQIEMTDRGYCSGAVVEAEDGSRYPVFFMHPVRLQQELQAYNETLGERWFAEPGLIIVDEVTLEVMQQAVHHLWNKGYFRHLRPLDSSGS